MHDEIQNDHSAPGVRRIRQFLELVLGGGAPIEGNQGRINGGQIQGRVGTSELSEARIGGGREPREQVQDAAA